MAEENVEEQFDGNEEEEEAEKKPTTVIKTRAFKLFDDEGASFSFSKVTQLPKEAVVPQARSWKEICLEFLKDESRIENFQQEDRVTNKNQRRRNRQQIFLQHLSELEKKDEEEQEMKQNKSKPEKTEREQQITHQSLALRKAALQEAKNAKRLARK